MPAVAASTALLTMQLVQGAAVEAAELVGSAVTAPAGALLSAKLTSQLPMCMVGMTPQASVAGCRQAHAGGPLFRHYRRSANLPQHRKQLNFSIAQAAQ
jgi:hypothetical protein